MGTRDGPPPLGVAGVRPEDVDLPQVYDGFSPFVYFWMESLGLCPPGEAHLFAQKGRIDSDRPDALPVLSGGGALGTVGCTACPRCSSAICS